MIIGIGTDIIHMARINQILDTIDDPFFKKIYTDHEREEGLTQDNKLQYFSGRFAAKEAVFKTFKVDGDVIHLKDIEVLKTETGYPQVNLYGQAKKIADKKGITRIELSISYDSDYAIAYAISVK